MWLAMLAVGMTTGLVSAQQTPQPESNTQPVSLDRETDVRAFVKRNHPELDTILVNLKTARPEAYLAALDDLARQTERLAAIRDSRRYELELGLWTARSRSQVLIARLRLRDTPALRTQLRALLTEEANLRLAKLEYEHGVVSERLDRVSRQLEQTQATKTEWIDAQFRRATADRPRRPAEKPSPEKPSPEKPASDKPTTKKSVVHVKIGCAAGDRTKVRPATVHHEGRPEMNLIRYARDPQNARRGWIAHATCLSPRLPETVTMTPTVPFRVRSSGLVRSDGLVGGLGLRDARSSV